MKFTRDLTRLKIFTAGSTVDKAEAEEKREAEREASARFTVSLSPLLEQPSTRPLPHLLLLLLLFLPLGQTTTARALPPPIHSWYQFFTPNPSSWSDAISWVPVHACFFFFTFTADSWFGGVWIGRDWWRMWENFGIDWSNLDLWGERLGFAPWCGAIW